MPTQTLDRVMSTSLLTISSATTVAEAATVMSTHHVGSLLVMDAGRLVGIFTERDIVRALASDFAAAGEPVEGWMTRNPRTLPADASVEEALALMQAGGFRHIPVVRGDRVVGVVSMRDLTRARG